MNAKKSRIILGLTLALPLVTAGCVITVGDGGCYGYDDCSGGIATTNIVVITSNTTIIVTNDNYHTNVVTNLIEGYCDIALTSPSDGVYVDGSFTVAGTVECPGSLDSVFIYFETADKASVLVNYASVVENGFEASVTVSREGLYNVWVTAWDSLGSTGKSEKVSVVADWTPPVLNVTSPESETTTVTTSCECGNANVTFAGTATDTVSGVQAVYVKIDCNPCEPVIVTNSNWTYIAALAEGTHAVRIFAMDMAGHMSLTKTYSVTVVRGQ